MALIRAICLGLVSGFLFFSVERGEAKEKAAAAKDDAAAAAPAAPAKASGMQAEIADWLQASAKTSPKVLSSARRQYETLREQTTNHAKLDDAFAVILMQQRRYDEAETLLAGVVKQHPEWSTAWRLKIWCRLSARKNTAALEDMQAAALALEKSPLAAPQTSREEMARFFGQVFGFLEGPRSGAIAPGKLTHARQAVASKFVDQPEALAAGEAEVSDQFAARHHDAQQARDAAAAASQDAAAEAAAKLKQERSDLEEQELRTEAKAEQLKEDVKQKLTLLDQQEAPLQKQFMQIKIQVNNTQMALGQIQLQLASLQQQATQGNARGSVNVGYAVQQANLNNQGVQLQAGLNQLNGQLNGVGVQIAAIEQQRALLVGGGVSAAASLKQQATQLKKNEVRLAGKEKHLSAGAKGYAGTAGNLESALATYVPFSFADESAAALALFAGRGAAKGGDHP